MKNYLIPLLALLIMSCGDSRPKPTYDETLNDVVLNFNIGTVGGDSVLKNFVKKAQADSVARQYSNPTMKEEMMFTLISDYIDAGQVDNAQHLYDNMLKYAEQEYGKVCQMTAITYKEKAHLYERVGDLDNAIQMMQKSAEVFKKLPKNDINYYKDAEEFIRRWEEQKSKQAANNIISFSYKQPINKYTVSGIANKNKYFCNEGKKKRTVYLGLFLQNIVSVGDFGNESPIFLQKCYLFEEHESIFFPSRFNIFSQPFCQYIEQKNLIRPRARVLR